MLRRVPDSPWQLVGVALFSGAMLFTEIGLTRLFAAIYYPPVVFSIVTLAVLGVGLGAGLAAWNRSARRFSHISIYMCAASLSTMLVLMTVTRSMPFDVYTLYFVLAPLPFVFSGLALATLFSAESDRSPLLYAADLIGAGAGAVLVVPLLNTLNVPNGLVVGALSAATAALPFARGRARFVTAVPATIACLLLFANKGGGWLNLNMRDLPVEKPISGKLHEGGQILETRWDAFARTDLVDPGGGRPYEVYLDGAAGSVMPPTGGHESFVRDIGFFPFATEQPQRVFLIGPGGGLDIWFGLSANARDITAVEVNAATVDIANEFAALNGDIYGSPTVRVVVDEGRSVLGREDMKYDLIFLSQVVTLAAERDGYSLVENTAYTVEAFGEYLDHLQPGGQIALKLYDEPTLLRALSTAVAALTRRGMDAGQALQHVIALVDTSADPAIPLLMIRATPYSRDDVASIAAVADTVGFSPLYLPGAWAEPPLDAVLSGETDWQQFAAAAGPYLAPTSDNQPFFFQFEEGLPSALRTLLSVIAAIVAVGVLLVLYSQRGPTAATAFSFAGYFALLGTAFMLIEITLIQQTRLFLGHPTYAVTIVLAVVLVGGGVGSGLAGRRLRKSDSGLYVPWWPSIGVIAGVVLWLVLWPGFSAQFRSIEILGRMIVVSLALLPVSLFLGMPFPLGLRAAGAIGDQQVAMGWAVNAVMSVAGSVLAITLAMLLGYTAVLITAGVLYGGAASLAAIISNRR